MKVYNKLVRDKIPQIIEGKGSQCKTRILSNQEYVEQLNIKLQEEMREYLESADIEELADLEEVIRALVEVKGCTYAEFDKIRQGKADKRGAFKDKIFLESVDED